MSQISICKMRGMIQGKNGTIEIGEHFHRESKKIVVPNDDEYEQMLRESY